MTSKRGNVKFTSEADKLLFAFLVHDLEVELPGRLLGEQRAFLRIATTHVHVASGNVDVGPVSNALFLAVPGLVNVGALQHDDPDFAAMGMQRVGKTRIELRE